MSVMKILVLGGNGFLGRHFSQRMAQAGHVVRILGRRPLPAGEWPEACEYRYIAEDSV